MQRVVGSHRESHGHLLRDPSVPTRQNRRWDSWGSQTRVDSSGETSGPEITEVARKYLKPVIDADIDTLVLGCTHYPLLTGVISYVVGNGVSLVSSAEETAKDLYRVLVENNLLHSSTKNADHRFLATGDAKAFETLARRFLGPEVGRVEHQIL